MLRHTNPNFHQQTHQLVLCFSASMASSFLFPTLSSPKPSSSFLSPCISHPPSRGQLFKGHSFIIRSPAQKNPTRLKAFFGDLPHDLTTALSSSGLEEYGLVLPLVNYGLSLVQTIEDLPEGQRIWVLSFLGFTWIYLSARPGVLIGAIDAYLLAPLQLGLDSVLGRRNLKRTDFVLGDRLGEGTFGVVYFGAMLPQNSGVQEEEAVRSTGRRVRSSQMDERFKNSQKVILKKVKVEIEGAKECGEFEEWFNYRLLRAAPETCAEFLGSFVADKTVSQFTKGGKWLVWKFEGDQTLADYMRDRNFPMNLESIMFGRVLKGMDSIQRNALIIKQIMRQIITSLRKIHDTGIVHRDVKPANLVVTRKGKIKLIDFGAATDLRIGKNYVPDRGLLDPDYCPPELFVLPEETPSPPPPPIAALLSPILWQLNSPDLFDMYSAGVILLQMATPTLRPSSGIKNFKSEIKNAGYDLNKWRANTRLRPDLSILDLDSGRGWDLVTKLISERGSFRRGRLSAAAALRHPYFLLGGDRAAAAFSKLSIASQ